MKQVKKSRCWLWGEGRNNVTSSPSGQGIWMERGESTFLTLLLDNSGQLGQGPFPSSVSPILDQKRLVRRKHTQTLSENPLVVNKFIFHKQTSGSPN